MIAGMESTSGLVLISAALEFERGARARFPHSDPKSNLGLVRHSWTPLSRARLFRNPHYFEFKIIPLDLFFSHLLSATSNYFSIPLR